MQSHSSNNGKPLAEGIFCDCYGTLFKGSEVNHPLVRHLNLQAQSGVPVTIFSSDPRAMAKQVAALNLHPDIVQVMHKRDYEGVVLETLIDDAPSSRHAWKTHWHPDSPVFKALMMASEDGPGTAPPPSLRFP